MRWLLIIFMMLPLSTLADDVRIAVGMDQNKVMDLIKENGGTDITSRLQLQRIEPKHEGSGYGGYWSLDDYETVIAISAVDGKIGRLTYWQSKDFDQPKPQRAEAAQDIMALTLDTKTKKASIEKGKPEKSADKPLKKPV